MKISHVALNVKKIHSRVMFFFTICWIWRLYQFQIFSHSLLHVNIFTLEESSALKKEAAGSSKILVTSYEPTLHHISEDNSVCYHGCKNLKSHIIIHNSQSTRLKNKHWIEPFFIGLSQKFETYEVLRVPFYWWLVIQWVMFPIAHIQDLCCLQWLYTSFSSTFYDTELITTLPTYPHLKLHNFVREPLLYLLCSIHPN